MHRRRNLAVVLLPLGLAVAGAGCGGQAFEVGPDSGAGGHADGGGDAGGNAGTGGGAGSGGTAGMGGSGGVAGTGASGGVGGSGGGSSEYCPSRPPVDQSPCGPEYDKHECWYGQDPRPRCRHKARCEGGAWRTAQAQGCERPSGTCPRSPKDVPDGVCASQQAPTFCFYHGKQVCGCYDGGGVPMPDGGAWRTWSCWAPPAPGCPELAPNPGTPCQQNKLHCAYGPTCDTFMFECEEHIWKFRGEAICARPGSQQSERDALLQEPVRNRLLRRIIGGGPGS